MIPKTKKKIATIKNLRATIKPAKNLKIDSKKTSKLWFCLIFVSSIALWVGHSVYIHNLFENVRFFSHLADFEREMAYRTEMGLYFSYYKTIVTAPTIFDGLHQIMHDNVTEYGHTINTLQRFNLYPEIVLGFGYRIFQRFAKFFAIEMETCWKINRGDNLAPVNSCVGMGNMHYFYINMVFGLAGSVLASVFLMGVLLSDSYFGGLISAAAFVFNHGEATRVQWTPPLRESFGFPIFFAQIVTLSFILKSKTQNLWIFLGFTILTFSFVLCWQFAQFALGTQLGALYVIYTLEYLLPTQLLFLWKSYMVAFFVSLIFLFGNGMLVISLFSTSLVAIFLVTILFGNVFRRIIFRPIFVLLNLTLYVICVFGSKFLLSKWLDVRDDNHVIDILRSKFTNFANFHTQLYTCSKEFDFLEFDTIIKLCETWLLPVNALAILLFAVYFFCNELNSKSFLWRNSQNFKEFSEIFYNVIQLGCFSIMALTIMRLKLFATPQLCAISAILSNKQLLEKTIGIKLAKFRLIFVAIILSGMAFNGIGNIQQQLEMTGEYSNPEQEYLFQWILKETKQNAVFAGSMPVMANLKLSTLRPIVNHPHYENEEIRNRTLKVYSIYSRKPFGEVYETLKAMGINYFVFQQQSCTDTHPEPNCTYIQMWDLEDPINRLNPPLCDLIISILKGTVNPSLIEPMKIIYTSQNYIILQL